MQNVQHATTNRRLRTKLGFLVLFPSCNSNGRFLNKDPDRDGSASQAGLYGGADSNKGLGLSSYMPAAVKRSVS